MKKLHFLLFIILSGLLVTACGQDNANPTPKKEENESTVDEEKEIDEKPSVKEEEKAPDGYSLAGFFMKDGAEVEFKGEGNEFAQFTAKTQWLNDRFVNVYEDNGGTVMLRTFRIDKDKIVVVQEEGESYTEYNPSASELEQLKPQYTYLQLPLKKGEQFDGWTVIDHNAKLDTPLQAFKNVFVIEKENEGGINRKYFAEGYGEIKREFIMKEGDEEFIVTSTIEKIK